MKQTKDFGQNDVLEDLDVSLLQNLILNPLFEIKNPREDSRIHFLGGSINLEDCLKQIDEGIFDLAFFLYPVLIQDLMAIADLGETMPPKSTWFEPKFLAGLITHEIDQKIYKISNQIFKGLNQLNFLEQINQFLNFRIVNYF